MTGRRPAVIEVDQLQITERFLELVATGVPTYQAANAVGMHRNTFYQRAARDPKFRKEWDQAQLQSRKHIAEEVLDKAMVATGRIVEVPLIDPDSGQPVLDEDLEVVKVRKLEDYDARILSKLVDRFVRGEDGGRVTNVAIQNNVGIENHVPLVKPRLIQPQTETIEAQYKEENDK